MRSKKKKRPEPDPDTPPDAEEVRARALALLARREHSARELNLKLQQRGYPLELIDAVLASLAEEDLLSETRFAGEWVRSRIGRGQGPNKIRTELRERGLSDVQIEQALAATEADWERLARQVRDKRFGPSRPATLSERARQSRFLESRGFTADQIRRATGGDPEVEG